MSEQTSITVAAPYVPSLATLQSVQSIVNMAFKSGLVKVKNLDDAYFIALYGLELSIPIMTSLRCIYSVNGGAPTCSGELLLALIRRSGKVKVTLSSTAETMAAGRATVHMKRLDSGDEFTATWGKDDDSRAQLRSNRDKYPAQMWQWRAVSIAAKALCSDIVGGMYTHEEIYPEATFSEEGDMVIEPVTIAKEAPAQITATVTPPAKSPFDILDAGLEEHMTDFVTASKVLGIKDINDLAEWRTHGKTPKEIADKVHMLESQQKPNPFAGKPAAPKSESQQAFDALGDRVAEIDFDAVPTT